jgi:hypothetical protein
MTEHGQDEDMMQKMQQQASNLHPVLLGRLNSWKPTIESIREMSKVVGEVSQRHLC